MVDEEAFFGDIIRRSRIHGMGKGDLKKVAFGSLKSSLSFERTRAYICHIFQSVPDSYISLNISKEREQDGNPHLP